MTVPTSVDLDAVQTRAGRALAIRYLPWAALFGCIVLTVWVWQQIRDDIKSTTRLRFEHRSDYVLSTIKYRMDEYRLLLRALAVDIRPQHTTGKVWRKRFEALRPLQDYPGIQNVGYAPHLFDRDKPGFLSEIHSQGLDNYSIRPAGQRPVYVPVAYTEPITVRTQRAFGFDMYSESTRREALDLARDSGQPSTTARVILVTENVNDSHPGIIMYAPVYSDAIIPTSEADRRSNIRGYVYGAFRTYDLLEAVLGNSQGGISIAVFDGDTATSERLLYSNSDNEPTQGPGLAEALELVRSVQVGGRSWTVRLQATPDFYATTDSVTPNLVLAAGTILALMIAGILRAMAKQQVSSQKLVQVAEELRQSIQSLEDRNSQLNLLREMSGMIQNAISLPEGAKIAARFVERIFGSSAGALFMMNDSRIALNAEAVWGNLSDDERSFSPNDCWALRRSRPLFSEGLNEIAHCSHVVDASAGRYCCIPMSANGETLGVLHIREGSIGDGSSIVGHRETLEFVTEQISATLGNLRLRENLKKQSICDPLTGLFNRRYLEETLAREEHRAARTSSTLGIIMLDVDRFKDINDTYGHEAGDQVLLELGRLLPNNVRKSDIACRFGGEEFALVLPGASADITCAIAEQIRVQIEGRSITTSSSRFVTVTVSIGVAIYPDQGENWAAVIASADRALYQAKANGRNQVVFAGSAFVRENLQPRSAGGSTPGIHAEASPVQVVPKALPR